jgi:hypothetical protein
VSASDRLVATVAALALKARTVNEFKNLIVRYSSYLFDFERVMKFAKVIWNIVKEIYKHFPN